MSTRISIITPSFNSGNYLERAIKSVLEQDYDNWEHIIIDGASTDNTLSILERYEHLLWESKPDAGQVDAMNKGFSKASGDIIGYLNADDYYLPGAFSSVVKAFTQNVAMVVGKVHVHSEKDNAWWVNDPKTDFESMIRHWELNAFCYNPVGYFFRREVQDRFPMNLNNDDKHDLEFLLNVSKAYAGRIKKINLLLGVYTDAIETKTFKNQIKLDYWRPQNFEFVDDLIINMPAKFKADYQKSRMRGYQLQTHWTIKDAIRLGLADQAYTKGDIIQLPCNEDEFDKVRRFGESSTLCAPGDSIVVILSAGENASQSLAQSLRRIPPAISAYPVYDLHFFAPSQDMNKLILQDDLYGLAHRATGAALRRVWDNTKDRLQWKFISGVREPVSWMISTLSLDISNMNALSPETFWEDCSGCWKWLTQYFRNTYTDILGADIFSFPFDKQKGYSVISAGNNQVLLYTYEGLNATVTPMIQDFLGVEEFKLSRRNEAVNKDRTKTNQYNVANLERSLDKNDLDRAYSHPIVRNFYTDEQIEGFYKRWAKRRLSLTRKVELHPYQSYFIDSLLEHVEVQGKKILEIGSDKQLAIGKALATAGAALVQCSNMDNFASEIKPHDMDNVLFRHCDGRDLPFADGSFDLIIGCALLEHVHNPDVFSKELWRVLKPGGHVYMHGEPLWTSSKGHHIYYVGSNGFYKFNEASNPIPDYGHLTMNRHDLVGHLEERGICESDIAGIVSFVYDSDLINRLSAREICKAFSQCFTLKHIVQLPDRPYPDHIIELMDAQGRPTGEGEVATLTILAEKTAERTLEPPASLAIVLCTGHKVGSTWVNNILNNMGINQPMVDHKFRPRPHMDWLLELGVPSAKEYVESVKGTTLFKSHSSVPEWISSVDQAKVKFVFVYRDPRDVIVSLSYYLINIPVEDGGSKTYRTMSVKDRIINIMQTSDEELAVVESWVSVEGCYKIRYEDMLVDPLREMKNLFDYLGMPYNTSRLEKAVDDAAFKKMSQGREPGQEDASSFYRKGIAGDWQHYFDDEVNQVFRTASNGRWHALTEKLGYKV